LPRHGLLLTLTLILTLSSTASAQSTYSTGFEPTDFTLGDVAGQNGWGHLSNSPTRGEIEPAPPGSPASMGTQSLAIRTRDINLLGVANHLYSATIDPPAGEPGSTFKGTPAVNPQPHFSGSMWIRTPDTPVISTRSDGRFAQVNPASKAPDPEGADRYANIRFYNTTNDVTGLVEVRMVWIDSTGFPSTTVAILQWGTWYRFDYSIDFVPGLDGVEPNDRFRLAIFDVNGAPVGSACGFTWEVGWRSGSFGGTATPRAVNAFDFWSESGPNNILAAHIDNFTMIASTPAGGALAVAIGGATAACQGGSALLTANVTGGSGTVVSYEWLDASLNVVGTGATFNASPGTYTLRVTDDSCATATSAPVTITALAPLGVTISGATTACSGSTTLLTASPTGGSGSIATYTWTEATRGLVGTGATLEAGPGSYTVTVSDASCGTTSSAPFSVTALPVLTVTISGNSTVEVGATTTLTANAGGGSGTVSSYEWRNAGGVVVGSGPTLVTGAGSYTVTITDLTCGSVTSATFEVVNPVHVPALGTWAMFTLLVALAGIAVFRIR
jgi:hypothetical protein